MKLLCKLFGHKIIETVTQVSNLKSPQSVSDIYYKSYCKRCKCNYYQIDVRNPFLLTENQLDEYLSTQMDKDADKRLENVCDNSERLTEELLGIIADLNLKHDYLTPAQRMDKLKILDELRTKIIDSRRLNETTKKD